MTYRIEGLAPDAFEPLFGMGETDLAERNARRTTAEGPGYPCRISLVEAEPGEPLMLVNHVSQEAETPFRTAHAVYVRQGVERGRYADSVPPIFETRTLGLRGFDQQGMLRSALLALPGEADAKIRQLFERPEIEEIHAHNAALGCFLARIERN